MIGEMRELNSTGDSTVSWDSNNAEEVAAARATFDRLVGKGFMAYKVTGDRRRGEQIRTFDPQAERIMLAPAMQGG